MLKLSRGKAGSSQHRIKAMYIRTRASLAGFVDRANTSRSRSSKLFCRLLGCAASIAAWMLARLPWTVRGRSGRRGDLSRSVPRLWFSSEANTASSCHRLTPAATRTSKLSANWLMLRTPLLIRLGAKISWPALLRAAHNSLRLDISRLEMEASWVQPTVNLKSMWWWNMWNRNNGVLMRWSSAQDSGHCESKVKLLACPKFGEGDEPVLETTTDNIKQIGHAPTQNANSLLTRVETTVVDCW